MTPLLEFQTKYPLFMKRKPQDVPVSNLTRCVNEHHWFMRNKTESASDDYRKIVSDYDRVRLQEWRKQMDLKS